MGAPEDYRLIIDCLLNVPLLYWAAKETGDTHYAEIADRHVHTALANVIREDFPPGILSFSIPEPEHRIMVRPARDIGTVPHGQEDRPGVSMEQRLPTAIRSGQAISIFSVVSADIIWNIFLKI